MSEKHSHKEIAANLARHLAAGHGDAAVVQGVAAELAAEGHAIRRVNICQYGICIDRLIPKGVIAERLAELASDGRVGKITSFPWGIPPFEQEFHVRVEQQFVQR